MGYDRRALFQFVGFLSERGIRIGKRFTVEKAVQLIEGYELSQWSPLDDREKESLRRRIAKRNEQEHDE